MYTIVLASQKGGSGKTTLAGHLAVQAELAGVGPVALIDTDPQGSLAQWWNARESESPHFVKVGLLDLGAALEELQKAGFKFVVIDTPPAITSSISQVVSHADLVIIPARPSPHDLRAVGSTADVVARHQKPMVFVVNCATRRARITGEAAVALSQHGTVAPVMLHNRVDYAASMIDGRTVGEVAPDSPSSSEIRDLWTYVQDRLSRLMRDPAILPEFRADHLAVSALSALDEPLSDKAADVEPPLVEPLEDASDMHSQRAAPEQPPPYIRPIVTTERRSHTFGRRSNIGPPAIQGE